MQNIKTLPSEHMSRRVLFQAAGLFIGATAVSAVVLTTSEAHAAAAKVHQATVSYQTTPKGRSRCDNCTKFQAPNACLTVEGVISPSGWCSVYAPKG